MRDRASLAPVKAHGYQKDLSNIPQFTTTSVHGRVSLALEYVQNSLLCTGISVPEGESIQALVLQVTGSFKDVGNENMPKTTILFSARCKVFAVSGASRSECNYLLKLHNCKTQRREKRMGISRHCNKRYLTTEDVVKKMGKVLEGEISRGICPVGRWRSCGPHHHVAQGSKRQGS